jgi:hypothetical protein
MRYTDIISRIVPFLATVTLGLLITSLFVPISAPRFGFGVRNVGHHNNWMKYQKLRDENERLKYENEQLRRVNSELIERLDDTLFENGLPEPPAAPKPKLPVKTSGSGYNYSAPVR